MLDDFSTVSESLPQLSDKDLLAMNQLMADKKYRIKLPSNFLISDRSDKVNPDFILYTLNDYLGHIQKCVASTKKMLPFDDNSFFYEKLQQQDLLGYKIISIVKNVDLKNLSGMLIKLQRKPHEVTIQHLIPFVHQLFQFLIRIYYLGSPIVSKKYKSLYALIQRELVPLDPLGLKDHTTSAIEEWHYIFDSICSGLYPLVLRMCSAEMLGQHQLFYSKGSRVLAWLHVPPGDILIYNEKEAEKKAPVTVLPPKEEQIIEADTKEPLPLEVQEGLKVLELLFPEAGWEKLENMPDMCPYFQPIFQFNDGFTQLAPDNPLQLSLILLAILEELFQGLRLIKFVALQPQSQLDEIEDINKILEDWILYQEIVFNKNFCVDLKEYTHQIYTQPEYNKSPYGRMLLSNMYTLIKTSFLPYFDIRLYGTAKLQKDDRLPPFFLRVMRLKRLLERYHNSIKAASPVREADLSGSVPGIQNPWDMYKFDISNPVSRRLNAICGGKNSKIKTNALLIQYTLSILNVLDWWINDKYSYAYNNTPEYLYRVIEPGNPIPAFGVKSRTDAEAIFMKHLKLRNSGIIGDN
jgi:hypothetical protein